MVAGRPRKGSGERKVRASQDTVMGNTHRPQGQGKCNREQTARRAGIMREHGCPPGKGETVR